MPDVGRVPASGTASDQHLHITDPGLKLPCASAAPNHFTCARGATIWTVSRQQKPFLEDEQIIRLDMRASAEGHRAFCGCPQSEAAERRAAGLSGGGVCSAAASRVDFGRAWRIRTPVSAPMALLNCPVGRVRARLEADPDGPEPIGSVGRWNGCPGRPSEGRFPLVARMPQAAIPACGRSLTRFAAVVAANPAINCVTSPH